MNETPEPKNIVYVGNTKRYKRWTILGVDADIVEQVKAYATKHGYTTGKALKELVTKALRRERS